ncbi:MAG: ABC transporter substrate-binding protein [Chloroflexi bacterium]|nr:ABC transporter substrate-binding protein [Chloroflexota bacterium]
MKSHYKIFSLFIILLICLAACTPQSSTPTEPASPETAATTPPEATPEASLSGAPSEPAQPVTVTFWYPYGEGSWTGDFLAQKISEFNEANPDIVVEGQSYQDYASIIEGVQRAAAGKNLPSIATIGFGYDDYIINSGLAQPLNPLLGDNADAFLQDFYPTLLQVTTRDGVVYGIPLALSVAEIFYFPDLFEQAGLDPENPPQTWEEFIVAANTIHEKLGIYGATFALDDPWILETAIRSNGAELLSEDGKTANLDSETAIKVLSDWGDGAANGSILYNADFMQTLQSFGAKQVAMFAVSSYGTVYYHDSLPEVKAMAFPAGEGYTFKSPAGGNSLYVLGNDDAERAAAMKFIEFLSSPEANAEWAENSGYLPTRASSLEVMADFIEGFDNYKLAVDAINNVVPPTQWPSRHALQINQILMQAIEGVMLGQMPADEALSQANKQINALLAQQ